jgi:hypothetical protein
MRRYDTTTTRRSGFGFGFGFGYTCKEIPLQKKMVDTTKYLTVISGIKGPSVRVRVRVKGLG